MVSIKEINIKIRTYYFFGDMINIKNFDSNVLKICKKSYKNTGYITIKDFDYVNIHSVNPLYFIVGETNRYIVEKNGNKYLVFASTDKNKEVLKKYSELWNGIKNLIEYNSIEKIDNKLSEYEKDFMKIKLNSDDNLFLNKILKLHSLTTVVRSVSQEDNKYYPQMF